MSNNGESFRRVTKAAPCPICGKGDACKVSSDGAVAMCKRIEQGCFKTVPGGWYFHRLIESPRPDYNGNGQAHRQGAKPQARASKAPKAYPDAQAAMAAVARLCGGSFAAGWTYRDADGGEFAQVIRYALSDGDKQYRPIHKAKDGYRIGDPSGLWPLYRLNELPADGLLWVTEGEKCADAAAKIGLPATTSAHGAGAAEKTDWTPLAGRPVCILPDHDEAGRKYAQDVARLLVKLTPPAKVKIVELPGLPEKGDIFDWIESRDAQMPETIRAEVEALAAKCPELAPDELIGGPLLRCMADVEAVPVSWLWPGASRWGESRCWWAGPAKAKAS